MAGEWEVVEEKPVSEWDVVSTEPVAAPPAPKRQVGIVESALRTAGEAARTVVGSFDMAAGGLASLFGGPAEADRVFGIRDERQRLMKDAYAPKPGEEFSTTGQVIGGLASAPVEIAGGLGLQHGVQRAAEVVERGGSVGEAGVAGATTGAVRAGMNLLPIKAGGAVGKAIESKVGGLLGGAATGATIQGVGGMAGRAAENAALPEGEQFKDLQAEGGVNPVEVGLGAALGAVPGAAQAGSAALKAQRAKRAKLDAPAMEGIKAAHDAGYVLTPSEARGGVVSTTVEGLSGEPKLAKSASKKNAQVTNDLVREDIGLPPDEPISRESLKAKREEAGEAYAAIKNVGEITNDARYMADLDAITDAYDTAAKSFPHRSENPFKAVIDGLKQDTVSAASAIEEVKLLRQDADKAYADRNKPLGAAYRAAAKAVDDAIDRHLGRMPEDAGMSDAVQKYREARKTIAKTYLADGALNDSTGNIDAAVYARALKRGAPLSGPGLTVAKFAEQFPRLAQKAERLGNTGGPTYADLWLMAVTGGKEALALGARPLARAALQSGFAQRRITAGARKAAAQAEASRRGGYAHREPPPEPEPTLGQGFEDVPPPTRSGPASPLGDLTPDWETTPGAGGEPPPAMSADGLVQAVDDPVVTTGRRQDLRSPLEIPAVPGRPDLPDALVTGAPAESAATPRANEAMMDPGAIEARRQQVDAAAARERAEPVPAGEAVDVDARLVEIDRLKAATQSEAVRAALDKRAAAVKKDIKVKADIEKKAADAAELRSAAEQTRDPEIKKALLAEADKLAKPEKIPAGEATEIAPEVIEPGALREEGQSPNAGVGKADAAPVEQAGPDGAAAPAAQRAQADEGRQVEGEVDGGRLRTDDLQPETRQEGVQADGGAGAQAGKEKASKIDRFYSSLIGKASSTQESSSGGRTIYSVKVTPQMANANGVQLGRWPETDGFALRRRSDVTGRPTDEGWVLIDKREQTAARNGGRPANASRRT